MTATDRPRSGKESFSLDFDLQHPPAKVWRALTTPELLEQWLLPVIGHRLETGAAFTFQAPPYPGWDGTVSCRYLEIEPQRTLRLRWDVPFLQTEVTFTLTPTAAGTRLTIMQSGFGPDQKQEFGGARYGWTMMGERLVELLARIA